MQQQFAGRVCIVTGGTQGLGEATARLLAERGAEAVVVVGRNIERGRKVTAALEQLGAKAHAIAADLGDMTAVGGIVGEADRRFGRVDVLVNAAALTDRGSILDSSPELFDRMFAVNVRAPFFLMQDAARIMRREGKGGTMVNILSTSGYGGQPFLAPYSASKGALGILTRNAAYALMRDRIRINGLNIGWMDTPGEHGIQKRAHDAPPDWLVKAEAGMPTGRLLKPAEVARAIAFLASDESGMMSGALVDFDQSVQGAGDPPRPMERLA
ncbi:MAG TPA: SDR family oxidoreductase [Geminicoccaceae bacterium]|nr:SDR family oxidoreductase [Geminicoccus sp.]HMU50362.1 SDR family oxidoreductase [Geminicoccaceae bacterium]